MRVALGVSGGVAAYKAAELVRRLQQDRIDVQVVMTRSAQEFIAPLTFAALTGQKVITDLFGGEGPTGSANLDSAIEHIAVAQRIDALVIAPATANVLAKLARGIANDFLTTLYLATTAPVIVAPAMNVNMWEHPATQENIEMLRARGVRVVSPDEGYLACGMTGAGRLAGVEAIARAVTDALGIRHDLDGETVLVTAGPTCEDLDPVRYLTNRSSGKMGYALADAAARRGARVVLVSGPTALDAPPGVERVAVRSTAEMQRAVLDHLGLATIVVMAAAVADYRPVAPQAQKIKRSGERLVLELEPTTDILADVIREKAIRAKAARAKGTHAEGADGKDTHGEGVNDAQRDDCIVVGFAAETDRVAEHAQQKLAAKSADMIVANDVTAEGAGFDHDTNVVTIFTRDGRQTPLPRLSKREVADRVFDRVLELRSAHPVAAAPER